jgi:hypothetical protein
VFEEPNKPTNPGRHGPQVPSADIDEQDNRFKDSQSGALEQSTRFKTVEVKDRERFKSPGLLVSWKRLIPSERKTLSSLALIEVSLSPTDTSETDREEESNWSNTTTAHEETTGRRVEVNESCICDLNTIRSEDEGEGGDKEDDDEDEEERYPNW